MDEWPQTTWELLRGATRRMLKCILYVFLFLQRGQMCSPAETDISTVTQTRGPVEPVKLKGAVLQLLYTYIVQVF